MKHIAIIPNYSGITGMIKGGEISPNFLVKSENDQKVYFSNSNGYKLVVSGNTYNMYQTSQGLLGYELEVDVTAGADLSFRVLGPDNLPITTRLDYDCQVSSSNADCNPSDYAYQGTETGVTNYELYWSAMETFGQASYQIILFIATDSSVENYVQVTGNYGMTDEEACSCAGGTWDPVNQECVPPPCSDRGLCGDDPYDCHECTCEEQYEEGTQELCDCQGKYWYGDECHNEPEPEPEPTCEEQGLCDDGAGGCVECEQEGCGELCGDYPDCHECTCEEQFDGDDQGLCECQGGTWDGENCNFDEGE